AAVQVTVGQIADRLDRCAPIHAAAIQAGDGTGSAIGIVSLRSLSEFQIGDFAIDVEPADPGRSGIFLEKLDGGGQEAAVQLHVAVHVADILSSAVLKAEL